MRVAMHKKNGNLKKWLSNNQILLKNYEILLIRETDLDYSEIVPIVVVKRTLHN